MSFSAAEALDHFDGPFLETGLTASEIQELLLLIEPETSVGPNRLECLENRKKLKRKLLNRESARRSRLRKKMYLDDLTNEVNRLELENQELKNQLGLVTHHCQLMRNENYRLRSESLVSWAKLSDLSRVLVAMQYNSSNNNKKLE